MNTNKNEAEKLPEDVELLLPWHAAGTLSRRDAARVEQALANDNELAARYEMVREELGEAIRLNETLGAPSARAMQQLFAKIDAEPVRTPEGVVQSRRLAHRFRDELPAAHAGLWRDGRGAGDRAAGGHPCRRVRQGRRLGFTTASAPDERQGRFRRGPVQPAGQRRRHHQIPRPTTRPPWLAVRRPAACSSCAMSDSAMSEDQLSAVVKNMSANPVIGFAAKAN